MVDNPHTSAMPQGREIPAPLLDRLREVLTRYSNPQSNDNQLGRALHAIGVEARASNVRAEQLIASLKRVFDSLTPPPTLASQDERSKRLAFLVTTCVREYYDTSSGVHTGEAGGTI